MTERQIKIKYNALKAALEGDLEERKLTGDVYRDKVQEYLALWERLQRVRNEIEDDGLTVWDDKRGMNVPNPCIQLEVQLSRQMLAIFQSLGFKDIAVKARSDKGVPDDEL